MFAAKLDDRKSAPRTHVVEGDDSCRLSYDLGAIVRDANAACTA